jgi:hypothetical protein
MKEQFEETDVRQLLKTYFKIQKNVNIPESKKNTVSSHLEKVARMIGVMNLKKAAMEEMIESKSTLYKLFCQSVILMGKIK